MGWKPPRFVLRARTPAGVGPAAGPATLPDRRRGCPDRLGAYEVLGPIGAGGMATLYEARHAGTGAAVAIKMLSPRTAAHPVLCRRFEQEFQAASRLDHPNLVRALEFGRAEAGPYLVMELVRGESLGERIARAGALPPAEAVRLIAQVGRALEYAHREGVLHRDVKPDNILIAADGTARLTDFGLAKQPAEDLGLTRPGRGLGTPNFIAPEQLLDAKASDRRCDVYGLGASLYMAVTGHCPFAARTETQVLKKKTFNELVLPRQLVPTLSARLEEVIRKAMHPDPGQRPGSCADLVEELTAAVGSASSVEPGSDGRAGTAARPGVLAATPVPGGAAAAAGFVEPRGPAAGGPWSRAGAAAVAAAAALGVALGVVAALWR